MSGSSRALYFFMLFSFFCFGTSAMLTGAALPEIIRDFNWNYNQSGIMLSITSLSFFITAIFAGRMLIKLNAKYLISASLFMLSISLFFFGSTSSFLLNVFLKVLFGVSFAIIEVSGNFVVSRMEKDGESHLMGILHAAFSMGAIVGPFILSIFLKNDISWTYMFKVASSAALLLLFLFVFIKINFDGMSTDAIQGNKKRSVYSDFFALSSAFIIMLYVGYEVGISDWGSEFAVRIHKFSPSKAASLVSIYWMGLFIGRIINPFIFKKVKLQMQLLLFSIIAVGGIAAMLICQNGENLTAIFAVTGYGCASIFPLVMTIIGRVAGADRSPILGLASAGGGLGGLVFPFSMSRISNIKGIFSGFTFYFIIGMVQLVMTVFYFVYVGKILNFKIKSGNK
ncbi:MAG: MFS transporter [Spirochaetes bacterium]|nr:MFS transporter [Spirochaetota bacterium]